MPKGRLIPWYLAFFGKLFENISPVKVASLKSVNEHLGSSDIGSNRDVVHIAESEEIHVVCLGGLGVEGIAEKQEHINLVAGNSCGNLLSAALRAAEERADFKTGGFGNNLAGCAGGANVVAAENTAVCDAELNHQLLFLVVSNKCNIHIKPPSAEQVGEIKVKRFEQVYLSPRSFLGKGGFCPSMRRARFSKAFIEGTDSLPD